MNVASRTRKRLAMDQRIRRAIMVVASPAGSCVRAGGLAPHIDPFMRVQRGLETGLGVDQELAGSHDLLPQPQPFADLHHIPAVTADLDLHRTEFAVAFGHDDDVALARVDHRFGGHHQSRLPMAAEVEAREHAGLEQAVGIAREQCAP